MIRFLARLLHAAALFLTSQERYEQVRRQSETLAIMKANPEEN